MVGSTYSCFAEPDGGSSAGATNRLYKNNRDGTFTDVTEKAGLVRTGWASSVTIGDYNNDGFDDIFITYYGQNVLYRNNGDGTFTDVTRRQVFSTRVTPAGVQAAHSLTITVMGILTCLLRTMLTESPQAPETWREPLL